MYYLQLQALLLIQNLVDIWLKMRTKHESAKAMTHERKSQSNNLKTPTICKIKHEVKAHVHSSRPGKLLKATAAI